MINRIKIAVEVLLLVTLFCALGRVAFYLIHYSLIAAGGDTSFLPMLIHGLKLDVAIGGYVTLLPCLLLICSVWLPGNKILRLGWNVYFVIISLALALTYITNIVLYKYWGFPLDSTPLFYVLSSPKDAMASGEWWQLVLGFLCLVFVTIIVVWPFIKIFQKSRVPKIQSSKIKVGSSVALLAIAGLLIIPIRGGFTVAVNNVGSVYFSGNVRLNHAAVNPAFSFFDSLTEDEDFGNMYRFMDDKTASDMFGKMTYTALRPDSLADHRIDDTEGTRVVIVVLESFSSYIMTEEGHVKGVTPTLDKLSHEGLYFKHFYANSFRTDRGLVSILSGYPAQPNMSLMKFPHKTNGLYSIARSLKADGYKTDYVYGGDANFTNMRSYLVATGFDKIISEDDYPQSERTSKWGVNDGYLFEKALKTAEQDWKPNTKNMMVVQTSSSHEPYDVPCHQFEDKILNAFYYVDHQLGFFIDELKKRDDWKKTVVVITPDHLGCWPAPEEYYKLRRYHIPLIITGGAVKENETIDTYCGQQDIAATLLAMLRLPHDEFTFSKDIFDTSCPHFAFFTYPDAVGMATPENQTMSDNVSGKVLFDTGEKKGLNRKKSQAYLQKLFDDIDAL